MNRISLFGRLHRRTLARLTLAPFLLMSGFPLVYAQSNTVVGISGTDFTINGSVTHTGTSVRGRLMNSRMINAIFDDENSATVGNWAYPDSRWDAQRNTNEFIAALPSYAASGLKAFTLGMQGGNPTANGTNQHPWIVSAFHPDGALKPVWLERADQVIRAADQAGLVVILQYFYQRQEDRFVSNDAVLRAADNMTDWVLAQGYRNVLIEIANEVNVQGYSKTILEPANVHQVVARVQARAHGRLKVSTSFLSSVFPPAAVISQSDYILMHGNGLSASAIKSKIDQLRATSAYRAKPKPIVFNEDSPKIDNLNAAVANGASWGYHEGGLGDYKSGFQYLPVNWTINTANKRAFFDRVTQLTGGGGPPATGADVFVLQTDTPDPVSGGRNLTYTITVGNLGPDAASGVTLTDTLPSEVLFVSASTGCAELDGIVTCAIGSLPGGGSTAVEIVVSPTADGLISNSVAVTATEIDPNAANNTATERTTVNFATEPQTDLSVTMTDSPDPAATGNSVTYAVTVTNNGPDTATGVTLTDTLPAGVSFVSASAGCSRSGNIVSCALGNLSSSDNTSVDIIVTPNAAGTISNTAQVSGNENDPNSMNSSDTEQTTVNVVSALQCNGRTPTIVGTEQGEKIMGTAGADIIHGLGGDDTTYGNGGNDIICGGAGNDKLFGGAHKDQLFGEDDNDRLDGGGDSDICDGGPHTSGDTALGCEQRNNIP